jgi:hypothetical protein
MEQEELNIILEKIENPPKGIKVKKNIEKIIVQINIHNIWMSMVSLFSLFWVLILQGIFVAFFILLDRNDVYEILFRWSVKDGIELPHNLILFFSCPFLVIFLLNSFLYSVFGRIELVIGTHNYIFQGIYIFGKKKYVNWKDILSYYVVGNKLCINTKDNKMLTISAKYLSDIKLKYLFSIIKYFKYKQAARGCLT